MIKSMYSGKQYFYKVQRALLALFVVANFSFGMPVVAEEEAGAELEGGVPPIQGMILTWTQDPTTSIVIDWHEKPPIEKPVLGYRKQGEAEWIAVEAEEHDFPFDEEWKIYRVELTGLEPDTFYEFRPQAIREEPYRFRTMPTNLDRPLRIVIGGDIAFREVPEKMNRTVAKLEPDLIIWGGDYAYSDGRDNYLWKEELMHHAIRDNLITEDRRVFPVLAAIGNHEVMGNRAPYYLATFVWPGNPPYGVMDFSDYMSVLILDSNHLARVAGEQTEWLEKTIAERAGDEGRILFPIYHVGAYPSVRDPEDRTHVDIREHWVPLFEQSGMSVAFEFHDHAYKRTHPMMEGEPQDDPSKGVTYLGDGAWGASTREPKTPEERPYLAKSARLNHVFVLDLDKDGPLKFQAIGVDGDLIEEFELPRKR